MQTVVANKLTVYSDVGEGPCLLLLHGWGDYHGTYNELSSMLKDNYRIVALDLPGFGGTQMPEEVWGLEDYAQFVSDFIKKLQLKPYAVIGHSNGGSVAIKAIAVGEVSAEKLILLACAGIRNQQTTKMFIIKVIAKIGKVLTLWLPRNTRKKLQKVLYGVSGSDMLVAPHLQETFKKTVKQDVQADAAILKLPTLLIYGDKDRATPSVLGEVYRGLIDNSILRVIKGGGHFIHHDDPEQVSNLIRGFLE